MERAVGAVGHFSAKHLQSFALWSGSEGKKRHIFMGSVRGQLLDYFILIIRLCVLVLIRNFCRLFKLLFHVSEGEFELFCGLARLGGMSFVADYCKSPPARLNLLEYHRELLKGCYNYRDSVVYSLQQLFGIFFDFFNDPADVVKLINSILQLRVQYLAVRNDNYRVEYFFVVCIVKPRKAVRKPGYGIRLPAACTVLNEVVFAGSICLYVGQKFCDYVKLVVAREYYGFSAVFFYVKVNVFLENFH